jgi:hypothetical protein
VTLDSSIDQSINMLSLVGEQFGRVVPLVVAPYTHPARACTTVMTASSLDNASTADELLGIGLGEAQDRRLTSPLCLNHQLLG